RHVALGRARRKCRRRDRRRRERRPGRPYVACNAWPRRDPARVGVAVYRAETGRRRVSDLPGDRSAAHAPWRSRAGPGCWSLAGALVSRWRAVEPLQSQDRDLLLCVPAAVRGGGHRTSSAAIVRTRTDVRSFDVSRESAGRIFCRRVVQLVAAPPERPSMAVSLERRSAAGSRRAPGVRTAQLINCAFGLAACFAASFTTHGGRAATGRKARSTEKKKAQSRKARARRA